MPVPNGNIFDGLPIVADATLTPSDGNAAGSSKLVDIGNTIDVVVTVINPSAAGVQMYWARNDSVSSTLEWAELGETSTNSQQTPMRLQEGFLYRLESDGLDVTAHFDVGPSSIKYDELTEQGLVA